MLGIHQLGPNSSGSASKKPVSDSENGLRYFALL